MDGIAAKKKAGCSNKITLAYASKIWGNRSELAYAPLENRIGIEPKRIAFRYARKAISAEAIENGKARRELERIR